MSTSMEPSTPIQETEGAGSSEDMHMKKVHEVMSRCGATTFIKVPALHGKKGSTSDPAHMFDDFRIVLITEKRRAEIMKAEKFVTCGQGDGWQTFDTRTGNKVIGGIVGKVENAMGRTASPAKFDALFALTACLLRNEVWIRDNECYRKGGKCERALRKLASAWKELLALPDAELGTLYSSSAESLWQLLSS
jgi:hypothetical protein